MFDIPSSESILGINCSEALSNLKRIFLHPEKITKKIEKSLNERQIVKNVKFNLVDGRVFEFDYVPIKNDSSFLGNLWNYRDITKRTLIVKAMQESEKKFKTLSNSTFEGIVISEKEKILDVNESLAQMLGSTIEEIINKTIIELVSPESRDLVKKNISSGYDKPYEAEILKEDGAKIIVEVAGKNIQYHGRTVCVTAMRDITNRKKEEEKRRKLEDELTRSERSAALGRVAAGIAHEINNPASAIQNDLYSISEYTYRLPDLKEKDKINEILSRDMDAISRIVNIVTAVKGAYRPEEWHYIDVNKEIDLQLILLYKKYKSRIEIKKDYNSLPQIKFYGSEFGQIVLNLLDNAIDAIPEKGEIAISTKEVGKMISISIKDTGTGIEKDVMPHIFDPFFTKKGVEKGTGLGLFTSLQIVKRHKGKIFVAETKIGEGATFILEFPVMAKIP